MPDLCRCNGLVVNLAQIRQHLLHLGHFRHARGLCGDVLQHLFVDLLNQRLGLFAVTRGILIGRASHRVASRIHRSWLGFWPFCRLRPLSLDDGRRIRRSGLGSRWAPLQRPAARIRSVRLLCGDCERPRPG